MPDITPTDKFRLRRALERFSYAIRFVQSRTGNTSGLVQMSEKIAAFAISEPTLFLLLLPHIYRATDQILLEAATTTYQTLSNQGAAARKRQRRRAFGPTPPQVFLKKFTLPVTGATHASTAVWCLRESRAVHHPGAFL
jgi:hypothetical protein